MDQVAFEKLAAAEPSASITRLTLVGFCGGVYVLLMDPAGTLPALAYAVLVLAGLYSAYLLWQEPYRRHPGLLSSSFISATDAVLITAWLAATGGFASPFYPLWYASIVALAVRFSMTEAMVGAALYGALYAGLLAWRGELLANPVDVTVRIGFIFVLGLLGALFSGVLRDQTVAKRTYQDLASQLEATNRELEASNEDLEQFASVASHDLKEPLRTVESYLRLLQRQYEGEIDEEADEFIGYATAGARRARSLVDSLLAYARAGADVPGMGPVDVRAALDDALADLQPTIQESQAVLEIGELPTVKADRHQLSHVFQNLVSNAIKHHGPGAPHIEVSAHKQNDGTWLLEVQDDGPGVPPDQQDQVFEIFQRGQGNEGGGSGVGLAICRRIVERHGGRIWVESQVGQGSRFRFILPAA